MTITSRRFLIADDHPLFRQALIASLQATFADAEFSETGDLDETLQALDGGAPIDLVLLDLRMPGAYGFSGLSFLRGRCPDIPVVIVSGVNDETSIRQAMALGASGYIPKSTAPSAISAAVQAIIDGGVWIPDHVRLGADGASAASRDVAVRIAELSPQQFTVLNLIARGLLNKQIAHELNLSVSTVKGHTTAILKKLGLQRRTQILAAIRELNLDKDDPGDL